MTGQLHITPAAKKGKLAFIPSLNVSTLDLPKCLKRAEKKETICASCYSIRNLKRYHTARQAFKKNLDVISKQKVKPMPIFSAVFRFNSHGELKNALHFNNLLDIAEYNPKTTFSLWTKERLIVEKVLGSRPKPKNLILIYSSLFVNSREKLPKHFNKVFTSWTKDKAKKINCFESCHACLKCYDLKNRTIYINEVKK